MGATDWVPVGGGLGVGLGCAGGAGRWVGLLNKSMLLFSWCTRNEPPLGGEWRVGPTGLRARRARMTVGLGSN